MKSYEYAVRFWDKGEDKPLPGDWRFCFLGDVGWDLAVEEMRAYQSRWDNVGIVRRTVDPWVPVGQSLTQATASAQEDSR